MDVAESKTGQLHSSTTILTFCFTSNRFSIVDFTHATTPAPFLSPKIFLNNLLSRCPAYHTFPTSFLPGRAYILAKYLRMLPPSTSRRLFRDSVVALVSDLVVLRAPSDLEDEPVATQALLRQNRKSVAEVRALGPPKSTKTSTVQHLYSDLIARLATAKSRSF